MKYRKIALGATVASLFIGGSIYAATNIFTALQITSGTRSGNVANVSDTSAVGGAAVRFGQAAASGACPVSDRLTVTSGNQAQYPAYPVGTKLYVPGSPDPWGGCFPGPGNTGVPTGTTLTNYTGPCTITTANTTIDSKTINCSVLAIRAANILITKSHVNGRVYIDSDYCGSGFNYSLIIRDSSIHTPDKTSRALMYCKYTAERVSLSGGGSQALCNNATIKDSYLHSPIEDFDGFQHNSALRVGANCVLEHTTMYCDVPSHPAIDGSDESSGCSADATAYSHDVNGASTDSTVRRNFYAGTNGGYCGYDGNTGAPGNGNIAGESYNMKFIENVFQRGTTRAWNWGSEAYYCGGYGPFSTHATSPTAGFEFTGNLWDNGKPLNYNHLGGTEMAAACRLNNVVQPQCTW